MGGVGPGQEPHERIPPQERPHRRAIHQQVLDGGRAVLRPVTLGQLATDTAYAGRGIGSGLLKHALVRCVAGARLIGRLELTLGMNFARFENGPNATSVVSFIPTLAVDIARSADRKAAFYGKFGLPLGVGVTSSTATSSNSFIIGFDFALGMRYAFHRMFALGFEGGAAGLFIEPQNPNPVGLTIFYAVLVGTFYYGR